MKAPLVVAQVRGEEAAVAAAVELSELYRGCARLLLDHLEDVGRCRVSTTGHAAQVVGSSGGVAAGPVRPAVVLGPWRRMGMTVEQWNGLPPRVREVYERLEDCDWMEDGDSVLVVADGGGEVEPG